MTGRAGQYVGICLKREERTGRNKAQKNGTVSAYFYRSIVLARPVIHIDKVLTWCMWNARRLVRVSEGVDKQLR